MDDDELLLHAVRMAERSTILKHQTGCVLYNKGIVSTGWSHRTHRRMQTYRALHAEHHAILRADPRRVAGSTLVIATIARKSGNLTDATPCVFCIRQAQELGIKKILATTSGGGYRGFAPSEVDDEQIIDKVASFIISHPRRAYVTV